MTLILAFPGTADAAIAEVGGKGHSLIRMSATGLPIPPGAVLTTSFFSPWVETIKASPPWTQLLTAAPADWPALCRALKALCPALEFNQPQRQALAALRNGSMWAVRSSSPTEDLATASFAGGYETRLGVPASELEDAVRHCFASGLDHRVFVYKQQRGFDVYDPRIAVVVQQQIDSQVAGVGFSLNPLTNDYDEAVIDANWGLGESVVAGIASADHFVIDKVHGQIIEKQVGTKQVCVWLASEGGTIQRDNQRSEECTLTDAQLSELTEMMCRIERLYQKPVDIEWAYDEGQLHILQARPITTYIPLPPEMLTQPGERRRLYTDAALSKGMAMNAPISPLGLDWMGEGVQQLLETFVSPLKVDVTVEKSLMVFGAGSRMYSNLSNMMWWMSPQRLSKAGQVGDALMASILANIDADRYRAAQRPWSRFGMLRTVPRIVWRLRMFLARILWSIFAPHRAHRTYLRRVEAYQTQLREKIEADCDLDELRRTWAETSTPMLFNETMPALTAGLMAMGLVGRLVRKDYRATDTETALDGLALAEKLRLGFTDNVVVEMGIALFHLAQLLTPGDLENIDRLAERIERRDLPAEFLSAWDDFLNSYGWRGPLEMDLASPRYADDPALALKQISFMCTDDPQFNPQLAHQLHVDQRRSAYQTLLRRSGWLRRALLRRTHTLIELFAGTRDTPKHLNLMFTFAVRRAALAAGRRLVAEGRLDEPQHVFDLEFDDLDSAAADPTLDLRELRHRRRSFFELLAAQVKTFPQVIDSRGRILRPAPRPQRRGELVGMAISPGVATGPVKVLQFADEKPIDKGDILVAYTTDPGWTPLFASAAAVVLEVGGVLQHGAVVAREYGKPCVAGIDRVTTKLHDGQRVEVNGTTGTIRMLSPAGQTAVDQGR